MIAFSRSERGDMSNIYEFNVLDGTTRPLTRLKGYPVAVDILPGRFPNAVSLKSDVRIPVAILSAPGFDPVQEINEDSITFGPTGDERSLDFCTADEVNGDGVPDLICYFETASTGFQIGSREGILRFMDVNRIRLEGRDSVRIVP